MPNESSLAWKNPSAYGPPARLSKVKRPAPSDVAARRPDLLRAHGRRRLREAGGGEPQGAREDRRRYPITALGTGVVPE